MSSQPDIDAQALANAKALVEALSELEAAKGWQWLLAYLARRRDLMGEDVLTNEKLDDRQRECVRQHRKELCQLLVDLEQDYQAALLIVHRHGTLRPDLVARIHAEPEEALPTDRHEASISPFSSHPAPLSELHKHTPPPPASP